MRITNLAVPRESEENKRVPAGRGKSRELYPDDEKVPVTQRVFDTIKEIRDSGKTNMFDYKTVQYFANELECFSTVCWIQNNVKLYGEGISKGFKVIEGTN